MKNLNMSYALVISFFTGGLVANGLRFSQAVDMYGKGQIEFMEAVLPLAVALENVYDAIEIHHDNCSVVWGYDIVEPFGEWVADFVANVENDGAIPEIDAIEYLTPRLLQAFNVSNEPALFSGIVAHAFIEGIREL